MSLIAGQQGAGVVPTHVGVNRDRYFHALRIQSRPHARGGEPGKRLRLGEVVPVVPTHVGVNR